MGRPKIKLTAEEEERIVGLLRQGMSCRKVGASVGRSAETVSRIANQFGLNTRQVAQQKARETGIVYDRIRRAEALDMVIDHALGLLPKLEKPGSLYNYAMGLAILYDKRRQEEITEQAGTKGAVIELVSRMVRQDVDTAQREDGKVSA